MLICFLGAVTDNSIKFANANGLSYLDVRRKCKTIIDHNQGLGLTKQMCLMLTLKQLDYRSFLDKT